MKIIYAIAAEIDINFCRRRRMRRYFRESLQWKLAMIWLHLNQETYAN